TGTGLDFYLVTLADTLVTHIAQRAGTGAQYPLSFDTLISGADTVGFLDEVTLSYSKIQWEYHPVSATGAPGPVVTGGWDPRLNQKSGPPPKRRWGRAWPVPWREERRVAAWACAPRDRGARRTARGWPPPRRCARAASGGRGAGTSCPRGPARSARARRHPGAGRRRWRAGTRRWRDRAPRSACRPGSSRRPP